MEDEAIKFPDQRPSRGAVPDLLARHPRAKCERAFEKDAILDAWDDWDEDRPPTVSRAMWDRGFVGVWNLQHPDGQISLSSIRRWRAARQADGLEGLIDHRGGNARPGFCRRVLAKFAELADRTPGLTGAAIHLELAEYAAREGLKCPSRRTVQQWLKDAL